MRRRTAPALLAFGLAALVAATAVALLGAHDRRDLAFTLGVPSYYVTAPLRPGDEACQTPILVPTAFDAVDFQVSTRHAPGSRLHVTVRWAAGGPPMAQGVLPSGYDGTVRHRVHVGPVPAGGEVAVCIRNAGRRWAGIYGGPDITARTSNEQLDGGGTTADLDLRFRRSSRSTLAMVPEMARRAALFRGGWIGPWAYWALLAGVLLAVPALLAWALVRATAEDGTDRAG